MANMALGSPWLLDTVHRRQSLSHVKADIPICRAVITRTDFDCGLLTFPCTGIAPCAANTNPVQAACGGATIQILVPLVHKRT